MGIFFSLSGWNLGPGLLNLPADCTCFFESSVVQTGSRGRGLWLFWKSLTAELPDGSLCTRCNACHIQCEPDFGKMCQCASCIEDVIKDFMLRVTYKRPSPSHKPPGLASCLHQRDCLWTSTCTTSLPQNQVSIVHILSKATELSLNLHQLQRKPPTLPTRCLRLIDNNSQKRT